MGDTNTAGIGIELPTRTLGQGVTITSQKTMGGRTCYSSDSVANMFVNVATGVTTSLAETNQETDELHIYHLGNSDCDESNIVWSNKDVQLGCVVMVPSLECTNMVRRGRYLSEFADTDAMQDRHRSLKAHVANMIVGATTGGQHGTTIDRSNRNLEDDADDDIAYTNANDNESEAEVTWKKYDATDCKGAHTRINDSKSFGGGQRKWQTEYTVEEMLAECKSKCAEDKACVAFNFRDNREHEDYPFGGSSCKWWSTITDTPNAVGDSKDCWVSSKANFGQTPNPTKSPSSSSSSSPSTNPTSEPTVASTLNPTTQQPTSCEERVADLEAIIASTSSPTISPTTSPTASPTKSPTYAPTKPPTKSPTTRPEPEECPICPSSTVIKVSGGAFRTKVKQCIGGNCQGGVPIGCWDTSEVTDMSNAFGSMIDPNTYVQFDVQASFNDSINCWNTARVTNMRNMFRGATDFNQPLKNWNVGSVTRMSEMFHDATNFNQPLVDWNVTRVKDMSNMFDNASKFNQPLKNWNVASVKDMYKMFARASNFNQQLNDWDVASVTDMKYMFQNAYAFNQPLNDWNVARVTKMKSMFQAATDFNQSLNDWNVASVTDMQYMFNYATDFNQCLSSWADKTPPVFSSLYIFRESGCQDSNLDYWCCSY